MSDDTKIASAHVRGGDVKYKQSIRLREGTITADEPAEVGGGDAGPSPYELLLAGLGACTSITLRMYADRKGWDLGGVFVDLYFFRDADKKERIERRLRFGSALSEEQTTRLLEIAEKTPVTKTVRAGTPIETKLQSG